MRTGKNYTLLSGIFFVCTIITCISIKVATFYPEWIERYYSRGIYPRISWFYRVIFGWVPFSFGDVLYAAAGCYLLIKVIKIVKVIAKRQFRQVNYKRVFIKLFYVLAVIYIYFNLSWGLNYNRPGIASQLQLNPQLHSEKDLKQITAILLQKVNENRIKLGSKLDFKPYSEVFLQAQTAYLAAAARFPYLDYKTASIKRSLYGRLGNFLGFLGYYNPFTGEAQVNLTQPRFLIPFVTCHEMGHQLGYASESEANFVGYLAAVQSNDTLFHYSAYFDLFNYANRELYLRDSLSAKSNYANLDTLVKADVNELREYWRKSDNVVEPLIKIFYDHYLKANQQTEGMKSYNEVVGWLIAYYKKYGQI